MVYVELRSGTTFLSGKMRRCNAGPCHTIVHLQVLMYHRLWIQSELQRPCNNLETPPGGGNTDPCRILHIHVQVKREPAQCSIGTVLRRMERQSWTQTSGSYFLFRGNNSCPSRTNKYF